jgi:hypothetical protein
MGQKLDSTAVQPPPGQRLTCWRKASKAAAVSGVPSSRPLTSHDSNGQFLELSALKGSSR